MSGQVATSLALVSAPFMGWGVGSDPITPFHDGGSTREGTQLDFWRGRCMSEHGDRSCGGLESTPQSLPFSDSRLYVPDNVEHCSLGTSPLLRAVCCGPGQMGQNRAGQEHWYRRVGGTEHPLPSPRDGVEPRRGSGRSAALCRRLLLRLKQIQSLFCVSDSYCLGEGLSGGGALATDRNDKVKGQWVRSEAVYSAGGFPGLINQYY